MSNIIKIEGLFARMDTVSWVRPYAARGIINKFAGAYVNALDRLRRLRGDENNHRLSKEDYALRVKTLEANIAQVHGILAFSGQYLTPEVTTSGADVLSWLTVPRVVQPDLTDARVSARAKVLRVSEAQVRQQLTEDAVRRTRNNALQAAQYKKDEEYYAKAIDMALQAEIDPGLQISEANAAKIAGAVSDSLQHYAGLKLTDAESRETQGQSRIAAEMYGEVHMLVDIADNARTIAAQFTRESESITDASPIEELAAANG